MPQAIYTEKIKNGELQIDAAQAAVMVDLSHLARAIERLEQQSFLRKFLPKQTVVKGLYIHGDVGRGKTMLMDLFYDSLNSKAKKRIHFHAFMQDIQRRRRQTKSADVIGAIAKDVSAQTKVLCLDEMQISDIADATIIGRLFEALMSNGAIIVTTSNQPPEQLYKDGFNRRLFLPAIKMLQTRLRVISLNGPTDYRLGRIKGMPCFVTPLGPRADAHIQKFWELLTEMPQGEPRDIEVLGRTLHVPQAAHGCARFTFDDLCEAPLGPADYLALAANFRTIFIERIPALASEQNNATKRFIALVDTLYDARLRLAASSAQPPEKIYKQGKHKAEFARTVSRLQEMQSASYWDQKIVET